MASEGSELLFFNGINASTGEYLVPPLDANQLSAVARGEKFDPEHLAELKWRVAQRQGHFGVKEGVDPKDIAQAGWGVIFPADTDPKIKDALGELLEYRKERANRLKERYHEYNGPAGFRSTDTKNSFLSRLGVGPGPVDPDKVPYYLLIVGDPDTIPYSFQSQLDVAYAVGRIHFDSLDDYARYAHSVVQAEKQNLSLPRCAAFFGVQNQDDGATDLSAKHLIMPLAKHVEEDQKNWSLQTVLAEEATKARLAGLLGGTETPALLFTAGHGIGFNTDDSRQLTHQGALLCQDWPGPIVGRGRGISPDWYFTGEDVSAEAQLFGLIAFHFACFSAGTPKFDDFAHLRQGARERSQIASTSFVANLPKRLLSHPKGGSLAVIGHVERAWGTSFIWDRAGEQLAVFESTLKRLMEGHPVGSATEFFNDRYSELSTNLSSELEDVKYGKQVDPLELSSLWTANNDARGYAIIGDPAVRLMVGDSASALHPVVESILLETSRARVPPSSTPDLIVPQPALSTATSVPSIVAPQPSQLQSQASDYGLFDSTMLKQTQARLMTALQQFADKLGTTLDQAFDNATTLEVLTYVSDDLTGVNYEQGKFTGNAKLRAITHTALDGDTLVCVPESGAEIDRDLWQIHLSMVQQAQANRAEMIKALTAAASGLLDVLKIV